MSEHQAESTHGASSYDDEFATCTKTYATLAIHKPDLDADVVRQTLGWAQASRDSASESHQLSSRAAEAAGDRLFLSSEGSVSSRDLRRHVDWLLAHIARGPDAIRQLRDSGYELYVSAYWMSAFGHGGPILSAELMRALGAFGLDLDFDIYMAENDS